jgi:glycosyltransferase involved in cell wall biosynthesis
MASTDRPRRALIIVQNLPVPFDRRVWLEATTLAEAGYLVSVISPKAKGYTASFEVLEDVHIYRYELPVEAQGAAGFVIEFLWCFLRTTMKTARVALRGRGFDVLHVCNPPEIYWPLARFCKLFGRRFLFDHHDLSPEMYQAKFGGSGGLALAGLRWLERQTFRAADLVVTTNESHKRVAVERGGVSPRNVYVVRSGPDLARLSVYAPDPALRRGRRHLLVYLGEICKQSASTGRQGLRGTARSRRAVHLHRPSQRRTVMPHPVLGGRGRRP